MISITKKAFTAVMLFIILSCGNNKTSDSNTGIDTAFTTPSIDTIHNSDKPIELTQEKRKLSTDEIDNVLKSVDVQDASIIYNENFEPLVQAKIKNNLPEDVVAFELIIDPNIYYDYSNKPYNQRCDKIITKEKIRIPKGQTIAIKKRFFYTPEDGCKIDIAKIYLGEFILESGKKTDLQMLFWDRTTQ